MTKTKNPVNAMIADVKQIRAQVAAARDRLFSLHSLAGDVVDDLDSALARLTKYKRKS